MSTLLQRVILPRSGDPMSVRALYMDERTGLALATVPPSPGVVVHNPVHLEGAAVTGRRLRVTSRTSAALLEQSEVSFGAYFNAFAAGYWRHWTPLTEVRLKLRLEGSGRVDVYRSKAEGARIHERGVVLGTRGVHEVDIALDLRPFEDGGWYWFDLTTDDDALTLHEGGWHAPVEAPGTAAVTIGMPTFNRPADCVATLTAIGEDPLVLAAVQQVIIPDQGTRKVRDEPGLRRRGGRARRPAADHRPAQPRRLRRLRPRHVRGARHAGVPADPVHGRRHPAGARLGAARRRVLPLRPGADARGRADAVAAGPLAALDDG